MAVKHKTLGRCKDRALTLGMTNLGFQKLSIRSNPALLCNNQINPDLAGTPEVF